MSLSATSTRLWDTPRGGDCTTSLGSPVRCLTTLLVQKFFLMFNVNLSWCNLRPFCRILALVTLNCSTWGGYLGIKSFLRLNAAEKKLKGGHISALLLGGERFLWADGSVLMLSFLVTRRITNMLILVILYSIWYCCILVLQLYCNLVQTELFFKWWCFTSGSIFVLF